MADASRFPTGVLLTVDNLNSPLPVGTLVYYAGQFYVSENASAASYTPLPEAIGGGITVGTFATARPAGTVVQVENGSALDILAYSLDAVTPNYAELRATGFNSSNLSGSNSLPVQAITATGSIAVQRFNTFYTVTGSGSITTTLDNPAPQYHGQVLGATVGNSPTATGYIFTMFPSGDSIYDPFNDADGHTLTWDGTTPGAYFILDGFLRWSIRAARGFVLS